MYIYIYYPYITPIFVAETEDKDPRAPAQRGGAGGPTRVLQAGTMLDCASGAGYRVKVVGQRVLGEGFRFLP